MSRLQGKINKQYGSAQQRVGRAKQVEMFKKTQKMLIKSHRKRKHQELFAKRLLTDKVIEETMLVGDHILIPKDVYSMTIAANLKNSLCPSHFNTCLKTCFMTFTIQIFYGYYSCVEYLSMDKFQPFKAEHSAIRIMISLLLHREAFSDFQSGVMLLTYLKRTNKRRKFMNVLLATMMTITPVIVLLTTQITIG